jgi:hypothetical protein
MSEESRQNETTGSNPAEASQRTKPEVAGVTSWILISIVSTGLLVGWLTGLSESPVAGIVLPLIITLIAGAGGFHFASKRPQTSSARDAIRRTAQATALFMVSCALGLHFGVLARTKPAVQPATPVALSSVNVQTLTISQIIRLAAFERRLRLLGVGEPTIKMFAIRYVTESTAEGHPGPASPPTLADLLQLETAVKDVSRELDNATGKRSSALLRFQNNIPMFLARIQKLREHIEKTQLAIPSEHYSDFLDVIQESNSELIKHREGNTEGNVLTPAPVMNYIPLYVLDLVVDIQKEPLGDRDDRRGPSDNDDIEMIDEAIRLSLNIVKPEPMVVPKYSVKR